MGPAQHAGHHSSGLGCAGAKLLLHLTAAQVWLCPALLNLLASSCSHPLSAL